MIFFFLFVKFNRGNSLGLPQCSYGAEVFVVQYKITLMFVIHLLFLSRFRVITLRKRAFPLNDVCMCLVTHLYRIVVVQWLLKCQYMSPLSYIFITEFNFPFTRWVVHELWCRTVLWLIFGNAYEVMILPSYFFSKLESRQYGFTA